MTVNGVGWPRKSLSVSRRASVSSDRHLHQQRPRLANAYTLLSKVNHYPTLSSPSFPFPRPLPSTLPPSLIASSIERKSSNTFLCPPTSPHRAVQSLRPADTAATATASSPPPRPPTCALDPSAPRPSPAPHSRSPHPHLPSPRAKIMERGRGRERAVASRCLVLVSRYRSRTRY